MSGEAGKRGGREEERRRNGEKENSWTMDDFSFERAKERPGDRSKLNLTCIPKECNLNSPPIYRGDKGGDSNFPSLEGV